MKGRLTVFRLVAGHGHTALVVIVTFGMLVLGSRQVNAQPQGILRTGGDLTVFLERQQLLGRLNDVTLTHRPLSAFEAVEALDALRKFECEMTNVDRRLLARYRGDQGAPGAAWINELAGFAYADGQHFYSLRSADYAITIDPLLYLSVGRGWDGGDGAEPEGLTTWQNTRGVRLAGSLGRVFFETRLEENQRVDPSGARQRVTERTGFAYVRDEVFDYWVPMGVVGYRGRYVEARFGRDRHQWGPQRNSLLLSDYAPAFEFIQLRTTVGPFQYANLFAAFQDPRGRREPGDLTMAFKYGAFHRLSVRLPAGVEVGISENVVLAPTVNERGPGFYMTFLNPIIFYRAVDLDIGSPGNMKVGLDASWRIRPGVRVRGEIYLDDFEADRFFSGEGYWKNTYGTSLGFDLVDLPVANTTVSVEWTRLRPYAYSNRTPSLAYMNRDAVLGYPMGPNAQDFFLRIDSRPTERLHGMLQISIAERGRNRPGENFGADPRIDYNTNRMADEDVGLPFGVRQGVVFVEGILGYEILPHMQVDVGYRFESVDDAEVGRSWYHAPSLMLRWGMPYQSLRY
jgi:hypothetical protein